MDGKGGLFVRGILLSKFPKISAAQDFPLSLGFMDPPRCL